MRNLIFISALVILSFLIITNLVVAQDEEIEFTFIPAWGSFSNLQGRVYNAAPAEHHVLVYIYIEGFWWPKPTTANPYTTIAGDCTWVCDITTGGIDQYAARIITFLVPADYVPPQGPGQWGSWPEYLSPEFYNYAYVLECRLPGTRVIHFSGFDWVVKQCEAELGPGPNYFSDDTTDVWVDELNDELHMRITNRNGRWYCSEVIADTCLGYGKYIFYVKSRVDSIDANAVLGLFTWDEWAPPQGPYFYREIDIEFSRWGNASADSNAQYVIQPWNVPENRHQFIVDTDTCTTHFFNWELDTIYFQSSIGQTASPPPANIIHTWIYTGDYIPESGKENPRINLWLFNGQQPVGGQDIEIIISGFEFTRDTTEISGPIWGEIGPGFYRVTGNLTVMNGDSLIINPSTTLLFAGNYAFDMDGYLYAVGLVDDSIKFLPDIGVPYWQGIDFNDCSSDSSRLEYSYISGSQSSGLYINSCNPTIKCLTIIGNSSTGNGGGILCSGTANLSIFDCDIENNTANYGGGIYSSADIVIDSCNIIDNSATSLSWGGGGIYTGSNSTLTIINSFITGNSSEVVGGGILCLGENPIIKHCLISENSAREDGGGIYFSVFSAGGIISNCAIIENTADSSGGGIRCYFASPNIDSCNISYNSAIGGYGGGLNLGGSSDPSISRCIISHNTAYMKGGGIYAYSESHPQIDNCIISSNSATVDGWGGGAYFNSWSDPLFNNNIIESNIGDGGIYIMYTNVSDVEIYYNDFFNNQGGPVLGNSVPPCIGVLDTVNFNGDSCDCCFNILMDPLIYATTGDSAYYLTQASPCIDAGDPDSPFDPDNTIADMGVYYFNQGILIYLTPINPPIIIPENGGSFNYNISLKNCANFLQVIDVWGEIVLPQVGSVPIFNVNNLNIAPNDSLVREREQFVPAFAPAGTYIYYAYIGDYPWVIEDYDTLTFIKEGILGNSLGNPSDWKCAGEPFGNEILSSITPRVYRLYAPYPNPFNSETILSFDLPEVGMMQLAIYNIQGQEVIRLMNERKMAGNYQVTFNASQFSSGIYFVRLTTRDFQQVQKLLLLK